MSRQSWLLPRSTSRDFPERNDLELIRTCEWAGLPQRQRRIGLASMSLFFLPRADRRLRHTPGLLAPGSGLAEKGIDGQIRPQSVGRKPFRIE
jgi:hypothetical protein